MNYVCMVPDVGLIMSFRANLSLAVYRYTCLVVSVLLAASLLWRQSTRSFLYFHVFSSISSSECVPSVIEMDMTFISFALCTFPVCKFLAVSSHGDHFQCSLVHRTVCPCQMSTRIAYVRSGELDRDLVPYA